MHRTLAQAIVLFERGAAQCHRPEDRALVERYLAALAPVLAGAVLGDDVLMRLEAIERLFGYTWLINGEPFEAALQHWRTFRSEYEQHVLGSMTINERLHALSLLGAFDDARRRGDGDALIQLLRRVHVDETTARVVAARELGNA